MEFRELASSGLKQNAVIAFNLTSSGCFVGLLGSTNEVFLLEMKHSHLDSHTFPYAIETLKLPTARPATEIVNKFDMADIYSKSECTKRQYFALDPVFVSELSEEPVKFQPVVLAWCPKKLFDFSILAVVTANGTCELRRRDTINREWKMQVCSLNQLYLDLFPVASVNNNANFEDLKEAVENTSTTAFSWNMDLTNKCPNVFVTGNGTGWILLLSLENDDGAVCCLGKHKTNLGRVSLIYFIKNFILVSFSNGIIKIFESKGNEISDIDTLWPNADRIPCKKFIMCFCKNAKKWICVTSKAAHVIVFVLSETGKLLSKNTKYLGNIKITGFDNLSPMEYIFVTITGVVKCITLKLTETNIEISEEIIKYDYDKTNYQILGIVSSPNKVAWTFILYHNKPYTQQSIYSPTDAIISVCSFNRRDAFKMLTDEYSDSIENTIDCAEIIRLEILKDNISPKFESISIQEVKFTKTFFKRLQLKLLIMNAGLMYQRNKFNHVKKVITNEINSLSKIIECVYINLRLQRLRSLKRHTPFQLLSGQCMKYRLKLLHSELITKEDVFRNVHENLHTLSDCLLMDLENMFEESSENCSYCDKPIDFSTLMCTELHSVPRCSISYLQVPLFTRTYCSSCNKLYVDDIDGLKSILGSNDDVKCTFCGFSISNHMVETFEKK